MGVNRFGAHGKRGLDGPRSAACGASGLCGTPPTFPAADPSHRRAHYTQDGVAHDHCQQGVCGGHLPSFMVSALEGFLESGGLAA